ncbi:hypothetical protein [Mycoplasma sp. CSL10166]|uniref:hypothetical protein n=1 Tax=Mycoplasma sp. CSL10166 TaxID=2813825 RepID=UPI00197BEF68|nr:hypothetical protein [Mycoplasma sp. CSL10166]MBN4084699.1 hypothetical protein [Mycoplasma sp. CSL10166]
MKVFYQIIQIKKYGKKVILFEALKYQEIKDYLSDNQEQLKDLNLYIQQSTIIKNKI